MPDQELRDHDADDDAPTCVKGTGVRCECRTCTRSRRKAREDEDVFNSIAMDREIEERWEDDG